MKKRSIAFLLSLVMLLSLLTPTALAEEPDQEGQATEESTEIPALSETTVAVPREAAFGDETTVTAPEGAESYQWQFQLMEGLWVNISGDESAAIVLTYAKVCNMLDESGAASLRCLVDGAASEILTVTVTDEPAQEPDETPVPDEEPVLEEEPVAQPVLPVLDPQQSAEDTIVGVSNSAVGAQEETGDGEDTGNEPATPSTYTILINYIFADGKQAAPSWSATVATGSTYTQDIQSPVVVGYTPREATVHVNTSEAKTYTVIYDPAEVEFTVKHYQQNVSNDQYTLVSTETKTGYTESPVGANLATTYEGFYSLLYDTTTKIAADGSTVVEVYYDRYYYLMSFDLDGGYGVEPIYARYGAAISVGTPTKPGYFFKDWDKEIPTTMPAENSRFKASWNDGKSGFIVVFWYENANDDDYSVAGSYKPDDVTPGTKKTSEDYKDQSFTGRDDKHFTYNAGKAENVTVAGDGSTVLNVYYTRNAYTLTFKGGKTEITCGKEEHEHTYDGWYYKVFDGTYYYGGCYPAGSYNGLGTGTGGAKSPTCGKAEHTHRNSCYKTSDLTITAKYQADIHKNFPIMDGEKTIWWIVPDGTETYGELDRQTYLGSIDTMPGEDITFKKKDSESGAKIYYYVETLNGTSGDTTYNGKNYTQYKVIDLDYSTSVNLTYKEEFHPITGFTQGDSNPYLPKDGSVKMKENNYLYYTRNSYNLEFYNYNAYVTGKGGSVQFEAPLSSYYFVPEYPANLEKNAYVFAGWYTTADCYEGSEADLNTMTMPASDVVLYAKWTPKTHTVKTYLTKDVLDKGEAPLNTWDKVPHGTAVENPPEDPTRDPYKFVGWFYISDTGEEKAFDFSMPVNRDLNLYAKWSSNTLMEYTIRYELENGTEIAPPTTGSALAGTTKTFDAKTGTQLYKDYQSGYFPDVSSHSLTLDIKGTAENKKNEFTFVYVAKPEVVYTVKYLEKGTEKQLAEPKTVTTRDAVVTETFKQITGYAPDAYQKQLVLAAEGNEIIFWYVKDKVHAPVQVIHWTQNIEGDGYTEYQSSTDLNGVIGNPYTEAALNIPGFTYNTSKSNASGTLTAAGLVLNLYYDRIEYPYEFRFLEQGTNKKLADPVTNTARYQAQVTQTAKDIPGYTLVSNNSQAINIAIEDPANVASKNVKTFYYSEQTVEIKYEVVGPTGCGTLDNYQESQLKVITGEVKGSAPTATAGFKFVGWYTDKDCTQSVDANWVKDSKLTPGKTKDLGNGVMGYEAATYYAKFEPDVADLTISKTGCANIDEHQSFIFTVKGEGLPAAGLKVVVTGNGSVTITGLKVGTTYTITEDTGWSWRYTPTAKDGKTAEPAQDIELQAEVNGYKNTVTFNNSRTQDKWLNGCSIKVNNWKKKAGEESPETN